MKYVNLSSRFICDFHRAQALVRWVNKGANGVNTNDKGAVLSSLKALAYATTGKTLLS